VVAGQWSRRCLGSGFTTFWVSCEFQLFLHGDKGNMVKHTCLVICIFIIEIKLNNVDNKHNKQHSRDLHHNFVSIIK
jgi:hypothetical protein